MRKTRAVGSFGIVSVTLGIAFAIACGSSSSDDSAAPGEDGSTGGNDSSKLGNDGSTNKDANASDAPSVPDANLCTSNPCVTQIAAAGNFTCALISDGTLRCWGDNSFGQLGLGQTDGDGGFDGAPYSVPVSAPGRTGIDEVATGDYFAANGWTCTRAGTTNIRCFGSNAYAQLGVGDASAATDGIPHPSSTSVVGLASAVQVSNSGGHSCAVNPAGQIACWGDNADFGLGRVTAVQFVASADFIEAGASNYKKVVAGEAQNCALTQTGTVECFGWNDHGQLGRPDAAAISSELAALPVANLSNVTQLVGGQDFYCALTTAGAVLCWGQNSRGQLGQADAAASDPNPSATAVVLPAGKKATLIGAGEQTGCALLDDDTLWCWGDDSFGELGTLIDGSTFDPTAHKIEITGKITQIVGGVGHLCVLFENGGVSCWGDNTAGQLGRGVGDGGSPDSVPHLTPAPVVF